MAGVGSASEQSAVERSLRSETISTVEESK
jgi:hypothetical protein